MNWGVVFKDVQQWMAASNEMVKRHGFESEEYWNWVVKTLGVIDTRYDKHPLVDGFLFEILKYQNEVYQDYRSKKEKVK